MLPSASLEPITRELSIAAWAWVEPTTAYWRTIVSRHAAGSINEHYGLTFGGTMFVLIFSHPEGNPPSGLRTDFSAPTGRWTHLAATFDGTTARLFSDGVLLGESTTTQSFARASEPLMIGNNENKEVYNEAWSGSLDDVMLWNRALSPDEIRTLATSPIR